MQNELNIDFYSLGDLGPHSMGTNITLLKASEVDDLFTGNDEKFKAISISAEPLPR